MQMSGEEEEEEDRQRISSPADVYKRETGRLIDIYIYTYTRHTIRLEKREREYIIRFIYKRHDDNRCITRQIASSDAAIKNTHHPRQRKYPF